MTDSIENLWLEKYSASADLAEPSRDILVAFNANIDKIIEVGDDLDPDAEPEDLQKASSYHDIRSALRYCMERSENREIELGDIDHEFDDGDEYIGGQAGIMANFLSGIGNAVIFYTPFLSEELAEMINEKVLYPVVEGEFVLKNVRDAANTDRTKTNLIFEYSGEETGRVIFSRKLKGFGPYFRKGVSDNFSKIDSDVDRIILSGFHDVEGNKEAKLKKSRAQVKELKTSVHLEFVYRNDEISSLISRYIIPEVESIGLDEDELKNLLELLEMDIAEEDHLSLGETFQVAKKLVEKFDLERIHVHTYRFHLTVAEENYRFSSKRIRDAMLFGELCAIENADKGEIPNSDDLKKFDMEKLHLEGLEELEHFQEFFELDDFVETGTAEVEGYRVAAIPTMIHEEPERLVGMGDIISSGAYVAELNQLPQ